MFHDRCDSYTIMTNSENDLKSRLIRETKREKWKTKIGEEEYLKNSNLFEEVRKKNLEIINKQNEEFKRSHLPKRRQVSAEHKRAYDKRKKSKEACEKECSEVSIQNLLLLIHYLNANPSKSDQSALNECLRQQNSSFEVFWDSPSYTLRVLRRCILTRDWYKMTYFLLILLNYDKKYLHVVKNMCRIMLKLNPLVKQYGLTEQFKILTKATEPAELAIV